MENLIKAKDEQIAKLNDLKELLKKQILSLQEENTKLKNELFEIEQKFKQLQIPKETSTKPDLQKSLNSINAKLSTIEQKLDNMAVEGLVSSAEPTQTITKPKAKAVNEDSIKKAEPHPAERGLLKPSALFGDMDKQTSTPKAETLPTQAPAQSAPAPAASFNAADPRSLQRKVLEIPYPESGVIQCPKCDGQQYAEMPEPARGSFAKKYYCKKCRQEWRFTY